MLSRLPIALSLASSLVACDGSDVMVDYGEGATASKPELRVSATDGTTYEGGPVTISVLENAAPEVQVSGEAGSADGSTWTMLFGASFDSLLSGSLSASLERRPLEDGVGTVTVSLGEDRTAVESGQVELRLSGGRVDGSASTSLDQGSGGISGRYTLSCWVSPESLGQAPNGQGDPGGTMRVQDERFESTFCQRLAHLR